MECKTPTDQVRVWVAACATGEEAYSIAILLCEYALGLTQPPEIQVFATDIDGDMIALAREDSYPDSILTDIPPTRLRNFFTKEPGGYTIKKSVREKVLFAAHDLLKDPPFSRLDLVACRNLMIYLDCEVQGQMRELFHFALRPGGCLFLGSSESADSQSHLFTALEKKRRTYRGNVVSRSALRSSAERWRSKRRRAAARRSSSASRYLTFLNTKGQRIKGSKRQQGKSGGD